MLYLFCAVQGVRGEGRGGGEEQGGSPPAEKEGGTGEQPTQDSYTGKRGGDHRARSSFFMCVQVSTSLTSGKKTQGYVTSGQYTSSSATGYRPITELE